VTHPAKIFRFERYKMADVETGRIDYDAVRDIARAVRPRILLAGYSSYPRELDYAVLADIAREVDAIAVADVAHIGGLIAAGEMDNPFDHGFDVVLTTTHKTLRGPRGGMILTADAKLGAKIDKAVFPGLQGGPIMQMVAAKAVSFKEAAQPLFKDYAAAVRVNAKAMAAQLLADGVKVVTGGTDNHLIMLDCVASFGRNGLELQTLLDEAGITVNKNVIPDDVNGAKAPSGIRLGSPAMTTRGAGEEDFRQIARWICELGRNGDASTVRRIKDEVTAFSRALPVPGDRLRAPAAG
jgi:glycine hydroxymethyltransferase